MSPIKQRAHIERYPNGKYAKNVKKGIIELKPLDKKTEDLRERAEKGDKKAQEAYEELKDKALEEPVGEEEAPATEDAPNAQDENADTGERPAPTPPAPPAPPTPPARSDLVDSYRKSLPHRLAEGVAAFFAALDGGHHMGARASGDSIVDALRSGRDPIDEMRPPNRGSADTLRATMRAVTPLAKIAAITVLGLAASTITGGFFPAMLAAFFVNRTLDASSLSRSAAYTSLSGSDSVDRLVNTFMDWAESLDADQIRKASENNMSVSASGIQVRTRRCPVELYRSQSDEPRRYILTVENRIRGVLMWDKKYGAPNKEGNGWFAVLFDGFNENSFQSEFSPDNLEPYTTIRKGDVILVNPARMPFEYARQWAISQIRR